MNQDLKIIKKKYGENMAKLCRTLFPTLLETDGLLPKLLLDNFEPNHSLYEDIIAQENEGEFKNFIYSFVDVEAEDEIEIDKTPEELLSEAGYDLYECKTEEDIQSFKKYYAKGEELCTFYGGRLDRCIVFFAVKKDVDNIKREDYPNPRRQDLYGTSVISIQFERDSSHALSIKNRYNHRVNNPDSTFSNDLDNIIPGLTKSFEKNYGLVQSYKRNRFELMDYVRDQDGKYYKYNYEIHNIYYCTNNVIVDHFKARKYPKDRYLVFDYFILDLKNKQIELYDEKLRDAFIDTINDIEKIEITKEENKKIVKIKGLNQEDIKITLNKDNQMIELSNPNVELVGDNFLAFNKTLKKIDLLKLKEAHDYFLLDNMLLQELNLPNLKKIGHHFLKTNTTLKTISLPKLQKVGRHFLLWNECLTTIDFPNLEETDNCFMEHNRKLETVNFPKLKKVGQYFLRYNKCLTTLDLPNLKEAGDNFIECNKILQTVNLPALQKVGSYFLYCNQCLTTLDLLNLEEAGHYFLVDNVSLQELNCPNLQEVGYFFLEENEILEIINLPSLQKVGDYFLYHNKCLKIVDFINLKIIGSYFLIDNKSLEELNCPNIDINTLDSSFMQSHPIFNGTKLKNNASLSKQKTLVLKNVT